MIDHNKNADKADPKQGMPFVRMRFSKKMGVTVEQAEHGHQVNNT